MASISTDKSGNRRILFKHPDGRRLPIRLGRMPMKATATIKHYVELLVAAKYSGCGWDDKTATWVADLSEELAAKLAAVELIPPRERVALKTYLEGILERRQDVKPATREVWRFVINDLVAHFGETRPIDKISEADALDFKQSLIDRKLAAATVAKRLQTVRGFFTDARRRKIIAENPFAEVSAKSVVRLDKRRFVTVEETERLLAVCDPTWRTIVGLARFGGLRCPSEVLSLRWEDVDFAAEKIMVRSPKTECHGKATRTIPLFKELLPILQDAYELADEGAVYVVGGKYLQAANSVIGWRGCNLGTQFKRLVKRAGLTPWPKIFHALRSSRETELAAEHPLHVVTAWLGNTPSIALKHYLLTTDADFARATGSVEAAQKQAQQAAETPCTTLQVKTENLAISEESEAVLCGAEGESWDTRIRT